MMFATDPMFDYEKQKKEEIEKRIRDAVRKVKKAKKKVYVLTIWYGQQDYRIEGVFYKENNARKLAKEIGKNYLIQKFIIK